MSETESNYDNLTLNFNTEPDTISLCCKKVTISKDELCLDFDGLFLDFPKINTLIFKIGDSEFEFKKIKEKVKQ